MINEVRLALYFPNLLGLIHMEVWFTEPSVVTLLFINAAMYIVVSYTTPDPICQAFNDCLIGECNNIQNSRWELTVSQLVLHDLP